MKLFDSDPHEPWYVIIPMVLAGLLAAPLLLPLVLFALLGEIRRGR